MEQWTGSNLGKVYVICILSPCLFDLYAEYIMQNAGLDEGQTGIKISRRNINNFRYADDTTLMAENEEDLKSLLMKVKEESEQADLELNIQKTEIMASGGHEMALLLGRKAMTNLDSILKSRDITLSTKVCLTNAVIFPVVMHGYESRTIKKAELPRIDALELWYWRRDLRVHWTTKR